jgi:hypothetical protein
MGVASNANPTGGIKAGDNAAFGIQPQGFGPNRIEERPARQVLAIPPGSRFEVRDVYAATSIHQLQIEKRH